MDKRLEAQAELRSLLPHGTTVYTFVRHTSRSGMLHIIDPVVFTPDMVYIGPLIARAYPEHYVYDDTRRGLRETGGNQDMGKALVYDLAARLYGDDYALCQAWGN